jgi:uncharacterized protein (UPF0332 family)
MKMSLQDWVDEGHLKEHTASCDEIEKLLAVFERDMADASVKSVSTDRRFATAYNAALMMARAALAASGYRTSGEANHLWTIQSLAFTLKPDNRFIEKFDKFRKKRNLSDYEMIGVVSEYEANETLNMARELHDMLIEWLQQNHPELLAE